MCGLAGILEFSQKRTSGFTPRVLKAMTDLLAHRGPDDEGFLLANIQGGDEVRSFRTSEEIASHNSSVPFQLGLSHKRLSILDLSALGHQPMTTPERDLWIVYNGEIFNYVEIRKELVEAGETFQSHSDTEVILKAYRQWGEACLERFNGMWAFVLWDVRRKILFCARDRFGIKPFYYYVDPYRFVFASEIKALFAHPQIPKRPKDEIIYDYLAFGLHDHSPETFFERIRQLPPSHFLRVEVKTGRLTLHRWWDIRFDSATETVDLNEAKDRFRRLLIDAIKLRLRSDIPVGICISGGLDSSSIAFLSEQIKDEEKASLNFFQGKRFGFSVCYEETECDDRFFIDRVVNSLHLTPYRTFPKARDLWEEIEAMTWFMDEPVRSTNQFAQWSLMKLIHSHKVRVVLSGQGSDEYLGGYRGYNSVYVAELLRKRKFWTALCESRKICRAQAGVGPWRLWLRAAFGLFPVPLPALLATWQALTGETFKSQAMHLLNPSFTHRFRDRTHQYWYRRHRDWTDLHHKLYEDVFRYSLPQLLHYEDRNGMAFSIEARQPFLDHRLVEYVFSLPEFFKIRDGHTKWLLREAVRHILPEEIRSRRDKKGFLTPESGWLKAGIPFLTDFFSRKPPAARDYLIPKKLLAALEGGGNQATYNQLTPFWRLVNLEIWLRRFF